jgi:CHAT domain
MATAPSLRIVCQVLAEDAELSFEWSDGAGDFEAYSIDTFPRKRFLDNASEARTWLKRLVRACHEVNTVAEWNALYEIAKCGHAMYGEIFGPTRSHQIRDWLTDASRRKDIASLEIIVHAKSDAARFGLNVPWNVVYENAPDEKRFLDQDQVVLEPFWARAYSLASGLRVDPLRRRPRLEEPRIVFVVDSITESQMLEQSPEAGKNLHEFIAKQSIKLVRTTEELKSHLRQNPCEIIYWFSHGSPEFLQLGKDKITAADLYDLLRDRASARPGGIVFLNACQSTSEATSDLAFLSAITKAGMSGIIGTEQETIDVYASEFGLCFLSELLRGGCTVGDLMRDLRKRRPLYLLYATYCPPHITVTRKEKTATTPTLPVAPALPTRPSARDGSGEAVGKLLASAASSLAVTLPLPAISYVALASYGRKQRALFAGRRADCDRFSMILDEPLTRILVLQGTSGVGKTSFLRAEVIPFLEEESIGYRFLRDVKRAPWFPAGGTSDDPESGIIFIRAGKDLVAEVAQALWDFTEKPYPLRRPDGKEQVITVRAVLNEHGGPFDSIEELARSLRAAPTRLHEMLRALSSVLPFSLLLIIDQAEEIFTQSQGPEATLLLREVAGGKTGDVLPSWRRSAIKNAYRRMRDGKGVTIAFHELASKREEAANMIPVRMSEDHLVHVTQIDIQFLRIREHCVGPGACVDENTVGADFEKSSEAPLADATRFAH